MSLSSSLLKISQNLETISRITILMEKDLVLDTTMAEEKKMCVNITQ